MHTAMNPVRNRASRDLGEHPANSLMFIVADMMSLIGHVQASARLIDTTMQRDIGPPTAMTLPTS